jgi:hypothetical protein
MLTELFRADPTNVGDWHCRPGAYLSYGTPSQVADVMSPFAAAPDGRHVIGGGGLISDAFPQVEQLTREHGARVVLWGVGHNLAIDIAGGYMKSAAIVYPEWMSNAVLVGVRDYGTRFEWVPCASCLDPHFDATAPIAHDVVVFEHKRIPIGIRGVPVMRNGGHSLSEALAFLSSGELVVTNSYHGAYWALLLGRRVIVVPFASKFFGFKHAMPLCAPDDWRRHRREAVAYPDALAECRERNIAFHEKVLEALRGMQARPGRPRDRFDAATSSVEVSMPGTPAVSPSGPPAASHRIAEVQRRKVLSFLPPYGRMLAWGLGHDATWFADRLPSGAALVCVEHDEATAAHVLEAVAGHGGVDVRLCPPSGRLGRRDTREEEDANGLGAYVRAAAGERFDVIAINGRARAACLTVAQDLLAPGGVVCLHDSQRDWYDEAKRAFRSWGVIGACPDTRVRHLWFGGLGHAARTTQVDGPMPVIVSYFTIGTPYEEEARRLIASCDALGVTHHVVPLPPAGSWEANCARKAEVCLDAWHRTQAPILWVDADAVMEAPPALLAGCDADFAVHRWNDWQFASGTIFFNRSAVARGLLERWVERCRRDPRVWDQVSLDLAWEDVVALQPLDTLWLPRSYCQIFDAEPDGDQPVVIRHHQASRRLKAAMSDAPSAPPPASSVALVRARTAGRPRRWHLAEPDADDFERDVSLERRLDAVEAGAPVDDEPARTWRAEVERAFVEACLREVDAELERCRDMLLEASLHELAERVRDRQPAPFAIYGAGPVGRALLRVVRRHGLSPIGFVETSPTRHGTHQDDLPIRSAAECRALGCHLYAIGSFASAAGMLEALDHAYIGAPAGYDALQPRDLPPALPDRASAANTLLRARQALDSGLLLAELR